MVTAVATHAEEGRRHFTYASVHIAISSGKQPDERLRTPNRIPSSFRVQSRHIILRKEKTAQSLQETKICFTDMYLTEVLHRKSTHNSRVVTWHHDLNEGSWQSDLHALKESQYLVVFLIASNTRHFVGR